MTRRYLRPPVGVTPHAPPPVAPGRPGAGFDGRSGSRSSAADPRSHAASVRPAPRDGFGVGLRVCLNVCEGSTAANRVGESEFRQAPAASSKVGPRRRSGSRRVPFLALCRIGAVRDRRIVRGELRGSARRHRRVQCGCWPDRRSEHCPISGRRSGPPLGRGAVLRGHAGGPKRFRINDAGPNLLTRGRSRRRHQVAPRRPPD